MNLEIRRMMPEGDESKVTQYERDMRKSARDGADKAVQEAEKTQVLNAQQRASIWNSEYERIETARFKRETSPDNNSSE